MELAPELQLWSVWIVRGIIILSTLCQIILACLGSERHRIKNRVARLLLWSTYMVANWAGSYLLGSMSAITTCYKDTNSEGALRLFSFWAPFIIFHFGGPDTITAYSLEDNELWLRSCLGMIANVVVAIYILWRHWRNDALGYVSILILLFGIVKYIERILSLRSKTKQHSQGRIYLSRDDPSALTCHTDNPLSNAYCLYLTVACQFGNFEVPIPHQERHRDMLTGRTAEDAFRLIQSELKLIYQVFYTKATVFCSAKGIIVRCICFISLVATLATFLFVISPRSSYQTTDMRITWFLIYVAIGVEVCSCTILFKSDWRKLWLMHLELEEARSRSRQISRSFCLTMTRHPVVEIDPNNRSRSESMGQYNLISFCLRKLSNRRRFGVGRLLNEQRNVTWVDVTPQLQRFIVEFVRGREINVEESWDKRYEDVLKNWGHYDSEVFRGSPHSNIRRQFGHNILYWHIATNICYYEDLPEDVPELNAGNDNLEEICRRVSDYMLYLYVMCPSMVSRGTSETVYPRICTQVREIIEQEIIRLEPRRRKEPDICRRLIEWEQRNRELLTDPRYLGYGCEMAQSLKGRNADMKWKFISELWREILVYAAIHCELNEHIQQLRRGGELLTYVHFLIYPK